MRRELGPRNFQIDPILGYDVVDEPKSETPMADPFVTIVVVLLFLFVASAILVHKQTKAVNYDARAVQKKNYDLDSISVLHAVQEGHADSLIHDIGAAEQSAEPDGGEKALSRALVWWTFVLAWATIVGATVAGFTLSAIRGQLDEMQADRRPWVSAKPDDGITVSKPLTFDAISGDGSIEVVYKLRNTGKSPALHVRFQSKIVILPMTTFEAVEMSESEDRFCERIRTRSENLFDRIIFPGDEIIGNWPMGIVSNDIKAGLKRRESGVLAHKGFVSFSLIGCVDYQISSSLAKHFQTKYGFILGIPIENGAIMTDIKPEGTRPEVKLIFFDQSAD